MNIFRKLFQSNAKHDVPAVPAWETIVEMMYDQHLDVYTDKVIQVIYSKDKSKRYVILQDENGFLTYQLEAIYQYDPDEWQYIASNKNALPAMWVPCEKLPCVLFLQKLFKVIILLCNINSIFSHNTNYC